MACTSHIDHILMTAREVKTKYVFSLFAPNNKAATLIGDFSDWKDIPMVKGDDGTFTVWDDHYTGGTIAMVWGALGVFGALDGSTSYEYEGL